MQKLLIVVVCCVLLCDGARLSHNQGGLLPEQGFHTKNIQREKIPTLDDVIERDLPEWQTKKESLSLEKIITTEPEKEMSGYEKYIQAQKLKLEEYAHQMGFRNSEEMQQAKEKEMLEIRKKSILEVNQNNTISNENTNTTVFANASSTLTQQIVNNNTIDTNGTIIQNFNETKVLNITN
eukprot:c17725_g1_i1.p1 GENE.c17725_g1_i1~~c17725_g1_i1.p1  ORF type:complete len:180 (-),score=57.93 c17725_g1_i1:48-587(-)